MLNNKNNNNNNNYKYSFALPIILKYLNINVPDDATPLLNFSFGIFLLSLICLLCFLNVVGYLTSIILINKYDIETKFPKLKKIIKYYNNTTLFFVFIEGTMCFVFLLIIICFSLMELGINIFK